MFVLSRDLTNTYFCFFYFFFFCMVVYKGSLLGLWNTPFNHLKVSTSYVLSRDVTNAYFCFFCDFFFFTLDKIDILCLVY